MGISRSTPSPGPGSGSSVADVNQLGEANAAAVIEAIRMLAPVSRADLARLTRFKPPTISGIVGQLVNEGLVLEGESERSESGRGRPSRLLRVNAGYRSILAVDIESDHLRAAVTDLNGSILNVRGQFVDRRSSPESTLRKLLEMIGELDPDRNRIAGIGVSCPGMVDEETGTMLGSTNLPAWKNVPLRQFFLEHFNAPVSVGRSIHLAAWAEYWFRKDYRPTKMIAVTLRTGIGFALVDNGEVFQGKNGFDGELGHTVVDVNGLPCECGRRGCLETFLSPASMTRRARALMEQGRGQVFKPLLAHGAELDAEIIYRRAREGDADCGEIVDDLIRYLAIGIGNLVNLFNVETVVLCGAIDIANKQLLGQLRDEVRRNCLDRSWEGLDLRLSRHAERSSLMGAAVRATQEYLIAAIRQKVPATV